LHDFHRVSLTLIPFISSRTDKKLILLEKQKKWTAGSDFIVSFSFQRTYLFFKKKENFTFRPKADSSIFSLLTPAFRNEPQFAGAKIKSPFLEGYLCPKHLV